MRMEFTAWRRSSDPSESEVTAPIRPCRYLASSTIGVISISSTVAAAVSSAAATHVAVTSPAATAPESPLVAVTSADAVSFVDFPCSLRDSEVAFSGVSLAAPGRVWLQVN